LCSRPPHCHRNTHANGLGSMTADSTRNITRLLVAWSKGNTDALDRLVPLVEAELRKLARRTLKGERRDHTLQTTALINEVYLRLIGENGVSWQNRAHFYGIAASIMRRILVDHARRRDSIKRGGKDRTVPFDEAAHVRGGSIDFVDVVALNRALKDLERMDARQARIVELRVFGGLSNGAVAELLNCSVSTVKREWTTARAWLYRALNERPAE